MEKSGDPCLGREEGWRRDGGAISLGGGGEGRQLRSAGWTGRGGRVGSRGRIERDGAGAREVETRRAES